MKFWPSSLSTQQQAASVIPRLLETQDKFISLLHLADRSPTAWIDAMAHTTDLPGNLFLKHLMVLSDLGGEPLQRVRRDLLKFFPKGAMDFVWREQTYQYLFDSLKTTKSWANPKVGVDGPGLAKATPLLAVHRDIAMLLLHGGSALSPNFPDEIAARCQIGSLLGDKKTLDTFVRQRYIHVSRITGGATANAMGQLCQSYVRTFLSNALPDWNFTKSRIPGISQNSGRTDTSFDIVAKSPTDRFCAIEVTFQVTTNSTIERKQGQALDRQRVLHEAGHKIAYVIDGAGNFQRRSAIATLCNHADCVVSFHDDELQKLVRFLRKLG